jgi:competence protein ComGC
MKTILISVLTILVIVVAYFLFFYNPDNVQTKQSAGNMGNNVNTKSVSNQRQVGNIETFSNKLSMKQIDSITALVNYNFTIQNYKKDVVSADTAVVKNKKL